MTDGRRERNIGFHGILAISILLGLNLGCSRVFTPPGQGWFGKQAQENQGWDAPGAPPKGNPNQTTRLGDQSAANGMDSPTQALDQRYAGSYRVPPKTPPKLIPIDPIPFPGDKPAEIATVANFSDTHPNTHVAHASTEPETQSAQPNQQVVLQAIATDENTAVKSATPTAPIENNTAETLPVAQAMIEQPEASSPSPNETDAQFATSDYHQAKLSPEAIPDPLTAAAFAANRRTPSASEPESEPTSDRETETCSLSESKRELINQWMTIQVAKSSDTVAEPSTSVAPAGQSDDLELQIVNANPEHFQQDSPKEVAPKQSDPAVTNELEAAGITVDSNAFSMHVSPAIAPQRNHSVEQPSRHFNTSPQPSVTANPQEADAEQVINTMRKAGSLLTSSLATVKDSGAIGWLTGPSSHEHENVHERSFDPVQDHDVAANITTELNPRFSFNPPSSNEFAPPQRPLNLQPRADFPAAPTGATSSQNQAVVQANFAPAELQSPANSAQTASFNAPNSSGFGSPNPESQVTALKLVNSQFCTEIKGYGQIVPFPANRFSGNQRMLVYCEVENFESEQKQVDSGTVFSTRFHGRFEILDSNGRNVQAGSLPEIEDRSIRKRRDFYLYFPVTFRNLSPGDYTLNLYVDERLASPSSKSNANGPVTETIPFTISP